MLPIRGNTTPFPNTRPDVSFTPQSTPFERFAEVYARARETDIPEPTATALATADANGRPTVRMVLLKGFDERGFVFYTNLASRKARDLEENPQAALCFHWKPLEMQVRIEGDVVPVTEQEADEYFASRPRGSQLGAWASRQSEVLESREMLENRLLEIGRRFPDDPVRRPAFWSGYRIRPLRIEFWEGRADRLHVRDLFTRDHPGAVEWERRQLYP